MQRGALGALVGCASLVALALVSSPRARAFVPPTAKTNIEGRGDMALIPATTYRMGVEAKWGGANPGSSSYTSNGGFDVHVAAFFIDRMEVTAKAYEQCVSAGACPALTSGDSVSPAHNVICTYGKPSLENHPINCVSHQEATKFCAYLGKRLPTEAEWELAERGPTGRPFPWGDTPPTPRHVNACDASCTKDGQSKLGESFSNLWADSNGDDGWGFTAPVGTYPDGMSMYGVYDLSGNVEEWVADTYWDPNLGIAGKKAPGSGPNDTYVIRGGSWDLSSNDAFAGTRRLNEPPTTRAAWLGFRCARDA